MVPFWISNVPMVPQWSMKLALLGYSPFGVKPILGQTDVVPMTCLVKVRTCSDPSQQQGSTCPGWMEEPQPRTVPFYTNMWCVCVCPSLNQKWWVWMFLIVICGDITSTVSILIWLVSHKSFPSKVGPIAMANQPKGMVSQTSQNHNTNPQFLCMVSGSSTLW